MLGWISNLGFAGGGTVVQETVYYRVIRTAAEQADVDLAIRFNQDEVTYPVRTRKD